jgi:hypothetical protein
MSDDIVTEQPIRRRPGRPRIHPIEPTPQPAQASVPALSEEDPRARAAARAAELREHLGEGLGEGVDEFYIDPRIIPDGWSYEWKRETVHGQPDPSYQVTLAQRGWEPVPASRHKDLVPPGWTGTHIPRKGCVLMERPKEITDEVRTQDNRRASEQVRQKEAQLGASPPGTFERDNKGNSMANIKKSYESIPIPEK